jgi:hypothetical protein
MVSPKRFRVALPFPGEYRGRVEKIAQALAGVLGRGKALYDRWHGAEFARPNLDVYLSRFYRDESERIVVFLCKAYDEKGMARPGMARLSGLAEAQEGRPVDVLAVGRCGGFGDLLD